MRASLLTVSTLLAFLNGCAMGSPPGFSDGETWSFPLVGSLEKGVLLAPVKIDGKGPFLFAIDPDLGVSAVDPAMASELELLVQPATQIRNHDDIFRPFGRVQVNEIEVGDLRVRNRVLFVKPPMNVRGRWVRGTLGRDVIAQSLIWAVDRDRGMSALATQGNLNPPTKALMVDYRLVLDRFLTTVRINEAHEATLHLDFGNHTSSLWPAMQKDMKLPRIPKGGYLRDEFGFVKETDYVGLAAKMRVGAVDAAAIEFAPMSDRRILETDYDGELGQNFFFPYNVTVNFHKSTMWLEARTTDLMGTAKERMRRWGARFDKCGLAACVKVALQPVGGTTCPETAPADAADTPDAVAGDPSAGAPAPEEACTPSPAQFQQLQIEREAMAVGLEYEVTLMAVDASGASIGAPLLLATLPAGAPTVFHPLQSEAYAAAQSFLAIDMSPFPRPCEKVGEGYRCVWELE